MFDKNTEISVPSLIEKWSPGAAEVTEFPSEVDSDLNVKSVVQCLWGVVESGVAAGRWLYPETGLKIKEGPRHNPEDFNYVYCATVQLLTLRNVVIQVSCAVDLVDESIVEIRAFEGSCFPTRLHELDLIQMNEFDPLSAQTIEHLLNVGDVLPYENLTPHYPLPDRNATFQLNEGKPLSQILCECAARGDKNVGNKELLTAFCAELVDNIIEAGVTDKVWDKQTDVWLAETHDPLGGLFVIETSVTYQGVCSFVLATLKFAKTRPFTLTIELIPGSTSWVTDTEGFSLRKTLQSDEFWKPHELVSGLTDALSCLVTR